MKIGEEIRRAKLIVEETKSTFTNPLKNVSTSLMEHATLSCDLSKPDRKVTWYKYGTEITASEKFDLQAHGTEQKLTVKNANENNTGQYTCRLGGEETSAKSSDVGKSRKKR